ncbi:hypothetical protein AB0F36_00680 [Streptomyces sp. NPDC029080]|nr:hypothetical protein [Streptomyces sp. SID2955]
MDRDRSRPCDGAAGRRGDHRTETVGPLALAAPTDSHAHDLPRARVAR